ncbi:MAG: EAL domain-containing protein [Acidimicrobiales bacterium]|nr:EAL domain-containing protein [Acidimicrobiales bacterium]
MDTAIESTITVVRTASAIAIVPLLLWTLALRRKVAALEPSDADASHEDGSDPLDPDVSAADSADADHVAEQRSIDSAERAAELHAMVGAALADDRMFMQFQPMIDLNTDGIVGVEGFARCLDDEQTVRNPGEFLAAIEQTPLVADLDYKAFELVCAAGAELKRRGLDLPVACNFAARTLRQADFVAHLEQTAAAAGMPTSKIQIEVTEAIVFDEHSRNVEVLHRLARAGFSIVLDDFGSGVSALTHLRDLPIDVVKIDRSLTERIINPGPERATASAIVHFAIELGITVVVEGIETAEQRTAATEIGAHHAQGWHYAFAASLDDLLEAVAGEPSLS